MQVILLERVENLGQMGDVVTVKPGYARNFLLPKKMALRATDANRTRFEQERTQLEASNLERKAEADGIAEKVEGLSVVLIRAASDSGQLYGSVNARDIADAVTEAGCSVQKNQVLGFALRLLMERIEEVKDEPFRTWEELASLVFDENES